MEIIQKRYISPESLRNDSFTLAYKIVADGFKPDFMVAIWRGGAPVGCYVHEFLKYVGIKTDHIAIRTSRYSGIDETRSAVAVHNLGYLVERLTSNSKVLLVDDVFDSGLSIVAVIDALREKLGDKTPIDIRVATVYYKPTRNKTWIHPNYYVHETAKWLVFPHELEGLTLDEISHVVNFDVAQLLKFIQNPPKVDALVTKDKNTNNPLS